MNSVPIFDIWRVLQRPRHEAEAEIRALCRTVYLGDHEALTRILGRYKLYVDTRDIGIASHLMLDGFWEMWVTEEMMRAVRRGSVVADVGANLGYFTMLLADLTGAEGRVLSFEPNPNLSKLVRKSVSINGFAGFTDFYDCALGSGDGEVVMDVDDTQPGGGRTIPVGETVKRGCEAEARFVEIGDDLPDLLDKLLTRLGHPRPKALARAPVSTPARSGNPAAIPVRRFDELPYATEVEFMKIDVEGFEPHVWAGMTKRLENYDLPLTIFMEFTIERFPDARGFLDDILGWGFSLQMVTHNNGIADVTPDALFAGPHNIDHMLVFRRAAR